MFRKKNNTKAQMLDAITTATIALKNSIVSKTIPEEREWLAQGVKHLAQAYEHVSNSK